MNFLIAILLSFTIPTFPTTTTPTHYTSNTIIIQETLTGKVWDEQLRSAIRYVDNFTGRTRMVIGTCDRNHQCLRIRFGNPGSTRIGVENTRNGTIILRKSWYGYDLRGGTRRNLIIHELGHYYGLGHNPTVRSVMYRNLYTGHTLSMRESTFTTAEKRTLHNH